MSQSNAAPGGYARLRLRANPFAGLPSIYAYETQSRPLFSAREAEVSRLRLLAGQRAAIFVVAPYGGGKTTIVLEALTRFHEEGAATVYAQFDRTKGFRESLRDKIPADVLTPGGGDALGQIVHAVRRLSEGGRQVILAVDDLDRAQDVSEISEVVADVRDLVSEGACLVVTGQPFGVTHDLHTSAGGIFHEAEIPEFSEQDFHEMLVRYLSSVHMENGLPPGHPFEDDAALFVCRELAAASLTPRLFNWAICEILYAAALAGAALVTMDFTVTRWPTLADRLVKGVTPLHAKYLQTILSTGQVSEDTSEAINALGESRLAEYAEVREQILRPLLEQDLLQVSVIQGKESFGLTPHVAAAVADAAAKVDPPAATLAELLPAIDDCLGATDSQEKGRLLEELTAKFISRVPGLEIPNDGIRVRSGVEELDVEVRVMGPEHHVRYGTFTICECKNWSSPVSWDELATLCEKLRDRNCKFGIFIALNGVTAGFNDKRRTFRGRDGVVIALLTEADLRRLGDASPATILLDGRLLRGAQMISAQYARRRPVLCRRNGDAAPVKAT